MMHDAFSDSRAFGILHVASCKELNANEGMKNSLREFTREGDIHVVWTELRSLSKINLYESSSTSLEIRKKVRKDRNSNGYHDNPLTWKFPDIS